MEQRKVSHHFRLSLFVRRRAFALPSFSAESAALYQVIFITIVRKISFPLWNNRAISLHIPDTD
jgi:hypothetical protein